MKGLLQKAGHLVPTIRQLTGHEDSLAQGDISRRGRLVQRKERIRFAGMKPKSNWGSRSVMVVIQVASLHQQSLHCHRWQKSVTFPMVGSGPDSIGTDLMYVAATAEGPPSRRSSASSQKRLQQLTSGCMHFTCSQSPAVAYPKSMPGCCMACMAAMPFCTGPSRPQTILHTMSIEHALTLTAAGLEAESNRSCTGPRKPRHPQ